MKKNYRKPLVRVCDVRREMLLAGSLEDVKDEYDGQLPLKSKSIFDYQDDDI